MVVGDVPFDQIRKAYKKVLLVLHPDKAAKLNEAERFLGQQLREVIASQYETAKDFIEDLKLDLQKTSNT